MIRLLVDEDFDNDILRGLLVEDAATGRRSRPDVGLSAARDPAVLEWTAAEGRIVLTHDVSTMTAHAIARVEQGQAMPGVFAAHQLASIGRVIDDLILLAECSLPGDWEGQIRHLPLQGPNK